jgi:competence protein ComEC
VWTVLGATISAQVAVAPFLLAWFGSVPLVAPLANLVAAPLVAAATITGGVGAVLGLPVASTVAAWLAGIVIEVARIAADLPQIDGLGALVMAALGLGAIGSVSLRATSAVVVVVLVASSVAPVGHPRVTTMAVLDVGQGDAILLRGSRGGTVLVDGGPDPLLLDSWLDQYGVRRIDLLVISHRHADHVSGLAAIPGERSVGLVWHPDQTGESPAFDALLGDLAGVGARVEVPAAGDRVTIAGMVLDVLGPRRSFASPNDESLVLLVTLPGGTILLPGDIEVAAQRELGPIPADVLKVPHQGAATSDPGWLAAIGPSVAVISVGHNDFGHPAPEVVDVLAGAGAAVYRTDVHGTIEVEIGATGPRIPDYRRSP